MIGCDDPRSSLPPPLNASSAAALNRSSATQIVFASNPQAQGATAKCVAAAAAAAVVRPHPTPSPPTLQRRYDTLVGVSFGSAAGPATGAAVNLGPAAQPLDLSPFGSAGAEYTTMAAASGSPTAAINHATKLAIAKGSIGAGGSLTLPPFSVVSWAMR